MLKKMSLIVVSCLVFLFTLFTTYSATAISPNPLYYFADGDAVFTGNNGKGFLGFVPWDEGVTIDNEATLQKGIWQIVANIATDITVLAAYLVLGYVIYGGYLYTFSSGDPGKIAAAKKTLSQALIGFAIVLTANIIMSTIRFALMGGGAFKDCATENCVNPSEMIQRTINWFIGMAGIVSAIFIIYGGILYITSAGDPSKIEKAKKMILYSLIGLIIVALSVIITGFVSNIVNGEKPTSYIPIIHNHNIT